MLNQPDDFRKIKSIKLIKSYFAYIWFEEADEFTDSKAIRQVLLSLFRNGNKFIVYYTFNTPFSPEHPLNVEWGTRKQYYYQHTTVYDLPREIISDEIWEEIEDMKEHRPKEYAHTILGESRAPNLLEVVACMSGRDVLAWERGGRVTHHVKQDTILDDGLCRRM